MLFVEAEERKRLLSIHGNNGVYGTLSEPSYRSSSECNKNTNISLCTPEVVKYSSKSSVSATDEGTTYAEEGPPNGGWGWVVVAASFLCLCVLDGTCYTFGIFLIPLMKDMNCGRGGVSTVGSFQV